MEINEWHGLNGLKTYHNNDKMLGKLESSCKVIRGQCEDYSLNLKRLYEVLPVMWVLIL